MLFAIRVMVFDTLVLYPMPSNLFIFSCLDTYMLMRQVFVLILAAGLHSSSHLDALALFLMLSILLSFCIRGLLLYDMFTASTTLPYSLPVRQLS